MSSESLEHCPLKNTLTYEEQTNSLPRRKVQQKQAEERTTNNKQQKQPEERTTNSKTPKQPEERTTNNKQQKQPEERTNPKCATSKLKRSKSLLVTQSTMRYEFAEQDRSNLESWKREYRLKESEEDAETNKTNGGEGNNKQEKNKKGVLKATVTEVKGYNRLSQPPPPPRRQSLQHCTPINLPTCDTNTNILAAYNFSTLPTYELRTSTLPRRKHPNKRNVQASNLTPRGAKCGDVKRTKSLVGRPHSGPASETRSSIETWMNEYKSKSTRQNEGSRVNENSRSNSDCSQRTTTTTTEKMLDDVKNFPTPKTTTDIRSLLGLVNQIRCKMNDAL